MDIHSHLAKQNSAVACVSLRLRVCACACACACACVHVYIMCVRANTCVLQSLKSWGSARDIFETIIPALYSKRASRLVTKSKMQDAAGVLAGAKMEGSKAFARKAAQGAGAPPPYDVEDVEAALKSVLLQRLKAAGYQDYELPEPEPGMRHMDGAIGSSHQPTKPLVKQKIKHNVLLHNSEDEDTSDDDIYTALEEACVALGYSEEDIAAMLEPGGDYKEELLSWIASKTGCDDLDRIRTLLDRQKDDLLHRMELIIEQRKKHQTEEEQKIQEKIKRIGKCPMEFEWIQIQVLLESVPSLTQTHASTSLI